MGVINITLGHRRSVLRLFQELSDIRADIAAFATALSGHTHGGVQTGAGTTGSAVSSGPMATSQLPFDASLPTSRLIKRLAEAAELLRVDILNLKTGFDGHTHGGITAGAGTTAAGPTLAPPPVVPASLGQSGLGLRTALARLYRFFNALHSTLAAYKAALDAHTHSGVTTGAATSGAGPSSPALASTNIRLVG